ncbi:MAG: phosphate signaling complex PhoU family protein, partial [Anaerolineae bacterium]
LVPTIDVMGRKAMEMLREALDAFVRRDVGEALAIADRDDEVDALYERVYRHLLDEIVRDPVQVEQANHLLWIAHNLERAADRVTNICERTIFTVTGEMREIDALAELPRDTASI